MLHNRKYIQLVQALDKKELKRFELYLTSPFFNKSAPIIALFRFLKKYHPDYNHKKCTKAYAFRHLYPKQNYSEAKFKSLLSELYKLLERFIIELKVESKPAIQQQWLLEFFHERQIDKCFVAKLKEAQKSAQQHPFKDTDYYYHQYQLERKAYIFQVTGKGRVLHSNLPQVIENLDYYYLSDKLRYCCSILNHQNIVASEVASRLLEEIITYSQQYDFEDIPAIALWYQLLLLLKEEDEQHYHQLKVLLEKQGTFLPNNELRQIYTAAINYCNKRLISGQDQYLREIFTLYQIMLTQEVLITEGYISPYMHYRNIVRAGVRLGELDWTEQFIYDYKERLVPNQRENIFNYSLAVLFFYKKDYSKTLSHLFGFEFQDFYHYIEHKTLLAKTYYELDEIDALETLLHTFRIYLYRSEAIPKHYQRTYQNFIKALTKIYKAQWDTTTALLSLKQQIEEMEYVVDKEWLLEKCGEIRG